MDDPYACAIVGAGPAGCACAVTLRRLGFRPLLLQREPKCPRPVLLETIRPAVRPLLHALFGSDLPDAVGAALSDFHSAWGSSTLDVRDYEFWSAGRGAVLDRAHFGSWLLEQTLRTGVEFAECCRLEHANGRGAPWEMRLQTSAGTRRARAWFAVNATGRVATRASAGFPRSSRTYMDRLVCLALRWTSPDVQAPAFALVESAAPGWWYAAADGRGECSLGLFADADLLPPASERRAWIAGQLAATCHLQPMVPMLASSRGLRIRTLDARTSFSRTVAGPDWAAVGDAGWCLDPLSGSGIERGLRSGRAAGKAIAQSLKKADPAPLDAFANDSRRLLAEQIDQQFRVYAAEIRWREQSFWKRRQSAMNPTRDKLTSRRAKPAPPAAGCRS